MNQNIKDHYSIVLTPVLIALALFVPSWSFLLTIWLGFVLLSSFIVVWGMLYIAGVVADLTWRERQSFKAEEDKLNAALEKIRKFTLIDAVNIIYVSLFLSQGWYGCAAMLTLTCVGLRGFFWNYKV